MTPLFLVSLLVFVALGIPVAFSIGLASLLYVYIAEIPLSIVAQRSVMGVYSYPFLALPFFVYAGMLLEHGGITRRLMRLANAVVGSFRGGLAAVTVVVSMMFGALSGSGVGGTAAVGSIMIPAMKRKGYDAGFAAALQGCSGVLASMIPPSLTIVIIGVVGGISIGRLFLGGILPGVLTGIILIIVAIIISTKRNYGGEERASLKELLLAFLDSILPLLTPVIILGGIIGGIFTVTEAAVVAVVYAFFLSVILYREVKINQLIEITLKSVRISAAILIIVGIASLFGWILTAERIPQALLDFFVVISPNKYVFLIYINLLVLLLGTFMESSALVIILMPALMPVVTGFGIDPVHFGILFLLNLTIGANTPPLGVTLMTAARIANVQFYKASLAVIPFLIAMIIALIFTTFIPQITLFLPERFF